MSPTRGLVHAAAVSGTIIVLTLNLFLVAQAFGNPLAG